MLGRMTLIVAAVALLAAAIQAEVWTVDKAHSSIGFSVRHLVITKTTGRFHEFDGQLEFDGKNIEGGSVEVSAQMASVSTDDEKRDEHLRSPEFFDVEKFPTMTFKSKKVIAGENGQFQLVGDLTIKGVTREVVFDAEFNGVATDPWGNTKAGFSAGATINRQDFQITWSKTLDSGGLVVGDEVKIALELEVNRAK